ncbi:RelE-like toxin of type II toxin-antitoxin system HigB [Pseudomonas mucidolens]|uniref:RelE-like toxin of type II toxin-antitoxin system HigB n=1 Tax=Pseudomonas mucidolens TaxID=46679 RepID=A0A1H2NY96_9PSED|nr:RelE-like toxin of type II toxin-antitoxin system HigB [Pseudomonas mucidolens]SQH37067.1 putative proteic killer suppression protein [Pseudomonas mucidolens]
MRLVRLEVLTLIMQSACGVYCSFWIKQNVEMSLSCLAGWRFHQLKGDLVDYWSVSVSGNWPIIFRMLDDQVELVDYLDYH